MKLHASGEDYLETILILQKQCGMVRSVDVARFAGHTGKPAEQSFPYHRRKRGSFCNLCAIRRMGDDLQQQVYWQR